MKKFKAILKSILLKHGNIIATCAFAFVAITANSSSILIYYETKEPAGLEKFKKFNH